MRLPLAAALLLGAPVLAPPPAGAASLAAAPRESAQVQQVSWGTAGELRRGVRTGLAVRSGALHLKATAPTRTVGGRSVAVGTWTSPWTDAGFDLTEAIPSWQARTSGAAWVEVKVRARTGAGVQGSWDTLARWAQTDGRVRRTSLGSQDDDLGRAATDTWVTTGARQWQVRVQLLRPAGGRSPVSVDRVGAVVSRVPETAPPTSSPGPAAGVVLDVPQLSQMTHRGDFPQWGGGGEAWCSPTSTAMVLGYLGALPTAPPRWLAGHADWVVDHTARQVFDHGYDGTGNWAFNTAYAGTRVREAYVTRFPDLRGVEDLVVAGTPVVVSLAWGRGELSGAPISSSNGHLMVVVGFTAAGDVVVNDPAAPDDSSVRRTYARAELERLWLEASGGTAYVIRV